MPDLTPAPGVVTPPIALVGGAADATAHPGAAPAVGLDDALLARLRSVCADVVTDAGATAEASRDWWPLAMIWATEGQVPNRAAAVARPTTVAEVSAVVALCNETGVPLTAAGGRSGVCGSSVPLFGGVVLDLTAMSGIVGVDDTSLVVDVLPGTFGDLFEAELQADHGLTVGHWPQSMTLATVGGWLACRGAGQYSTRYGKIEDIVVGLDVVLADGSLIHTGGQPRQAVGPDLTQLFVGSRGHARHHRRCPPQGPPQARRPSVAPPTPSTRSRPGSTPAGASSVVAPRPRCCGCTTSPRRPASVPRAATSSSCSTRATPP